MASDSSAVPVLTSDGSTTFGFTTIRVRVRNSTAVDESGNNAFVDPGKGQVPQRLAVPSGTSGIQAGYIVGIARFHLNPCYTPNLDGYWVTNFHQNGSADSAVSGGCSIRQTRSEFQEIAVSAKIQLAENGDLPGPGQSTSECANLGNINDGAQNVQQNDCKSDSALVEFDFSGDPIPFNATDLFLQVAYRGPIGDEVDGIAVGSVDLYEPTFFSVVNSMDWSYNNQSWTSASPTDQVPITDVKVCYNSQAIATSQILNPTEFLRIGLLSDQTNGVKGAQAVIRGGTSGIGAELSPTPRQSTAENYDNGSYAYYQNDTYYGIPNEGLQAIRGIVAGDGWLDFYNYSDESSPLDTAAEVGAEEERLPNLSTPSAATALIFTSSPDDDCVAFLGGTAVGYGEHSASKVLRARSVGSALKYHQGFPEIRR